MLINGAFNGKVFLRLLEGGFVLAQLLQREVERPAGVLTPDLCSSGQPFLPEQCGTSLQQNADQPIAAIIDNAFQCLLQAGAGFGGHMHKFGL